MSADGNTLAIGAPNHLNNGLQVGSATVYQLINDTWTPLGAPIFGDADGADFGFYLSLSADGSRLAVGAPRKMTTVEEGGEVSVYEWQNDQWIRQGQPMQGLSFKQRKGWHVSISSDGQRVVASAPWSPAGLSSVPGYVVVYEWQNGQWAQLGSSLQGKHAFDLFGWGNAIAADGNRVAVGAIYNEDVSLRAGSVRVFEWQNGDWQPLGAELYGDHIGNVFGATVSFAVNGNRLGAGGYGNNAAFPSAGHGRMFDWNGSAWVQVGMDVTGEASADLAGSSLSLSADGRRMAIDATYNDGNGIEAGQVRIFEFPAFTLANKETAINSLVILPNPASIWVEIKGYTSGAIQISDLHGRICLFEQNPNKLLNVSGLPAGVYLLKWFSEHGIITGKLLKG